MPVPHLGFGWVQACISILETFSKNGLDPKLYIPRTFRRISPAINVKQAIPSPLPYHYLSYIGRSVLNLQFDRALARADTRGTLAYFWSSPSSILIHHAHKRGIVTVREMINTSRGAAKAILDDAYDRLGMQPENPITSELISRERDELQMYDYIISSSPRIDESLLQVGISANKILRSSFGWSPSEFTLGQREIVNTGFRALFIGGDMIRKGAPQLLRAWKMSGVEGELLIVGDVKPSLKTLFSPYMEDGSVRLQAFTTDLGRLYRSSDLFILPSLEEGDPQVTYQAAGCGLPIIATPMGGGNILRDGINGILVQPNDVSSLAEAICLLAKSPELRKEMGARAAEDALNYTYEKIGQQRAGLLRNVGATAT